MDFEHRILITGANGFVGSWLLRELEQRKAHHAITVLPVGHGVTTFKTVDITDNMRVSDLIQETQPTAVIHLAAVAAPAEAQKAPYQAWDINVKGTMNLAYSVLKHVPNARFIYISTSEVYGASFLTAEGKSVSEQTLLQPLTVYGASKAAADIMIAQMVQNGLQAVRFRPFNHTGPEQTGSYVVPSFVRQIAEIRKGSIPPVMHVGNLHARRDFLDVRDVVRAYADAALNDIPQAIGKAFNLATGEPVSIQSILDQLIHLSDMEISLAVDPQKLRDNDIPVASGNAEEVWSIYGWKPAIPFEKTLSDTLASMSSQ